MSPDPENDPDDTSLSASKRGRAPWRKEGRDKDIYTRMLENYHFKGVESLRSRVDYDDVIRLKLPKVPFQTVAEIASRFSSDILPEDAVERAFKILEFSIAGNHATSINEHYSSGIKYVLFNHLLETGRKIECKNKRRVDTNLSDSHFTNSDFGLIHNDELCFKHNVVLKNLMPQVERVVDREKRFAEWFLETSKLSNVEAQKLLKKWQTEKLIPSDVYLTACIVWREWWEQKERNRRSKQVRSTRTSLSGIKGDPLQEAVLLALAENAMQREGLDSKGAGLTQLIGTDFSSVAVDKLAKRIRKPRKRKV